jgi:hypothetical protein
MGLLVLRPQLPIVPAPDDSDCREIGGMKLAEETEVLWKNLP